MTLAPHIDAGRTDDGRPDRVALAHSDLFVVGGAVLLLGVLALRAAGLAPSVTTLLPALAFVALVAGLPHGALDPWISYRNGDWRGVRGFVRWHALYLGIAAGVVAAFVLAPTLALAGFLVLSVVHFSDDWNGEEAGMRGLPRALRLVAAAAIVVVPCVTHPEAVTAIFAAITGTGVPLDPITPPNAAPPETMMPNTVMLPTLWALGGTLLAAFVYDRRAAAEIAVVVGLAVALPPLGFFLAYFAGLHSPRHVLREREAVPGGRHLAGVAAYTALALALCVGVTLWAFGGRMSAMLAGADPEVLRAVFVGLAALTVPHVILVEGLAPRRHDAV